ncbi:hypothetical protein [Rhodopila sp.]|uniref:hypothetical protein n=1 Tax=Rhodopila sp. TaxID=2480087 RepID=UPI003D135D76
MDDEIVVGNDVTDSETALRDDLDQVVGQIIDRACSLAARSNHPQVPDRVVIGRAHEQQLMTALDRVEQSGSNYMGGDLRAVVGSFHFRFRKALYDSLIVTASLSAAVIAAISAPGPGGLALVAAVVDAIDRFEENVTKLDANELLVYSALSNIQHRKRAQAERSAEVTALEIEDYFSVEAGQAPDKDDIIALLQMMHEKKVVRAIELSGERRYSVIS